VHQREDLSCARLAVEWHLRQGAVEEGGDALCDKRARLGVSLYEVGQAGKDDSPDDALVQLATSETATSAEHVAAGCPCRLVLRRHADLHLDTRSSCDAIHEGVPVLFEQGDESGSRLVHRAACAVAEGNAFASDGDSAEVLEREVGASVDDDGHLSATEAGRNCTAVASARPVASSDGMEGGLADDEPRNGEFHVDGLREPDRETMPGHVEVDTFDADTRHGALRRRQYEAR